jgi:hypothetical protein
MDRTYADLIKRIRELRAKGTLPKDVEKRIRDTLSTIVGFLEAMKTDGLVLEVSEFFVPDAIAYYCRFDNGNELVVCCGTRHKNKRFETRVARGDRTNWTKADPVTDYLAEADIPEHGVLAAKKLIDYIVTVAGERPRP